MTLSTTGISGGAFRSPRSVLVPSLGGIAMNYVLLAGFILGLNFLLIRDEALRSGFIILAAVPPAVAVIPFTGFLNGNSTFSLIGSIGCYVGALIIMPLIALGFLGSSFVEPLKLLIIMVELIIMPLILSRILIWTGMAVRIEPVKGPSRIGVSFWSLIPLLGLTARSSLTNPYPCFRWPSLPWRAPFFWDGL